MQIHSCGAGARPAAKYRAGFLNSYTVDNFGFLEVKEFITHWFKEQPELGEQLQIQLTQPEGEKTRHLLRTPFNLALLCQN